MGHLITIVVLLAAATIGTGLALPLTERFDRSHRHHDEDDPRAAELAACR